MCSLLQWRSIEIEILDVKFVRPVDLFNNVFVVRAYPPQRNLLGYTYSVPVHNEIAVFRGMFIRSIDFLDQEMVLRLKEF